MSEKIIEKVIDKRVDIDFDFADISDRINFSRYQKLKPAPRLKYRVIGLLSTAAVAVLAVTVIYPLASQKFASKNSASLNTRIESEENIGAIDKKNGSFDAASSAQTNATSASVISDPTHAFSPDYGEKNDIANNDLINESDAAVPPEKYIDNCITEDGNIVINGDIARFITKNGTEFELGGEVVFKDAFGNIIDLKALTDGEFVTVKIDEETNKVIEIRKFD